MKRASREQPVHHLFVEWTPAIRQEQVIRVQDREIHDEGCAQCFQLCKLQFRSNAMNSSVLVVCECHGLGLFDASQSALQVHKVNHLLLLLLLLLLLSLTRLLLWRERRGARQAQPRADLQHAQALSDGDLHLLDQLIQDSNTTLTDDV